MNNLSKRERTIIEKYISANDFSLNSLEKCISDRQLQIAKYKQDIKNIQNGVDSKIGVLTDFKQIKNKTPKQQIVLEDYNPAFIQLEAKLFCEAIEEKIKDIEEDNCIMKGVRDVFIDRFGEDATSNPSSPRSQLESPQQSPTFAKRRSSGLFVSPRRLLKSSSEKTLPRKFS